MRDYASRDSVLMVRPYVTAENVGGVGKDGERSLGEVGCVCARPSTACGKQTCCRRQRGVLSDLDILQVAAEQDASIAKNEDVIKAGEVLEEVSV